MVRHISKGCPVHGFVGTSGDGAYLSISANQRAKSEDIARDHTFQDIHRERDRLRNLIKQFLSETGDYEEMFVSELRDRVGDFRDAARADLDEAR